MNPEQIQTLINLLMLIALFAGLAGWWLTRHGGQRGRIAERTRLAAHAERIDLATGNDDELNFRARVMRRLARIGDKLPLFDAKYRLKLRKELIRSGYRSNLAVSVLLASKFCVGLICATLTVMLGSHIPMIGAYPAVRGAAMLMVFIVGMIVPEYLLNFVGARRRRAMAASLPDALDLLVICTNAGNSLGVSIRRVADELASICPPLSDEFSLTADELKLSGDSTRALNGLAELSICLRSARSFPPSLSRCATARRSRRRCARCRVPSVCSTSSRWKKRPQSSPPRWSCR